MYLGQRNRREGFKSKPRLRSHRAADNELGVSAGTTNLDERSSKIGRECRERSSFLHQCPPVCMTEWPPTPPTPPTACAPRRFLPTTSSLDHGCKVSATETQGRALLVERGYRCHEYCKEGIDCDTNYGGLWFCRYSFIDDSGTFSPLLR